MLNPGILDRMAIALHAALNPAWPMFINDTLWLLGIVSTIYLIGMSLVTMAGMLSAIPSLAVALAKYMGVVWVLTNAQSVSAMLINMHASIGLTVSGTQMSPAEFALPGRILWQGQDMLWPLINYANQLSWLDYAKNFFQIQFMAAAMWLSWIAFFLFALNMFLVQVQVAIAVLLNVAKLAFGLFGGTKFLAMEGIHSILSQLFRLATVSLLVGLSTPWMQWLAFPEGEKPGYWSAFAFVGGVWTILVLAFAGPRALQVHGTSLVTAVAGTAFGVIRGVSWGRR